MSFIQYIYIRVANCPVLAGTSRIFAPVYLSRTGHYFVPYLGQVSKFINRIYYTYELRDLCNSDTDSVTPHVSSTGQINIQNRTSK